jgi:amino acid transporter
MADTTWWEQALAGILGLLILFMVYPGVKGAMQKSRDAEEKHWGSVALIVIVLIAFIMLMIASLQ